MSASENELAAIRQELNELRQAFAAMRSKTNGNSFLEAAESSAVTDRRGMLKKVAGLAVGVATVGLLRPSSSQAANGANITAGRTTGGRRDTVSKIGANVPDLTGDNWIVGVSGFPGNNADMATGLTNSFADLLDVQLEIDQYSSTPFIRPANTNIAVVGHVDDEGSATSAPGLVGVWGEARSVFGARTTGVFGMGGSVGGEFDGGDAGVVVKADRATLCLFSTTEVFPPTSGTGHALGEIVVATDYSLWYIVTNGAPAIFRRLAAVETAGSLAMLPVPQRIIDTRPGSGFFGAGAPFTHLDARTFNILTITNTIAPNTLPPNITAILARATCMNNTAGSGLLQARAGSAGGPDLGLGTAIVNFADHESNGNTFTSNLDSTGNLRVAGFLPSGGSFNVIIDIIGYYI